MGETQRNQHSLPLSSVSRTSFVNKNNKLREFFDNMENYSHVMLQKIDGYWLIKQRSYSCHTMSRSSHLSSESIRPRVNLDAVTEDKVVNSVSVRRSYGNSSIPGCNCCSSDEGSMFMPITVPRRNPTNRNQQRYIEKSNMSMNAESSRYHISTLPPTDNPTEPRFYEHKAPPASSSAWFSGQRDMTKADMKNKDMLEINRLKSKIGLTTERYQGLARQSNVRTKQTQFIKFNSPVTISAKDSMRIKVKASAPAIRIRNRDQSTQLAKQQTTHPNLSAIKLPAITNTKHC